MEQPSSGSGGEPGSSLSDPGQRADSRREARLWVLWGGEEGRVARAQWESGKGWISRLSFTCLCHFFIYVVCPIGIHLNSITIPKTISMYYKIDIL